MPTGVPRSFRWKAHIIDGEFALNSAEVAEEEAVGRNWRYDG
jgi:hypothetical protein